MNKVKQVQHDNTERKRLKDAKPKANSRGLLVRGNEKKNKNGVCKDAERQRARGLESPTVLKSPVFTDGLIVEPTRIPRV